KPATEHNLKMLLYGAYGAGKTVFAGTSQDVSQMRNVLYIDAEGGTLSLQDRDDIDVVRVTNYGQFAKVYEFLRLHCRFRDNGGDDELAKISLRVGTAEDKRCHTVVIGSLAEVRKMAMRQLLGLN